jgi:copper chaperone CopZ
MFTNFKQGVTMKTLKLSIPNMKCMGCTSSVESRLKKIGGVTEVKTDLESKTATVSYNGDMSIKNLIISTLKGIGYPGDIIE